MRYAAPILAAAVALASVGPATAQALAPDQADVRCLMVLQLISRDPKQQDQAAKGIFYYLGRLSSRGPTARIEGLMRTEAPQLQPAQAQAELTRCAAELNSRGKELQAVNQRLAASARPPAATPAKK